MIKRISSIVLFFILITNITKAQNDNLSEGAAVLFKGVTTKLTAEEKNQIFKSTGLELNSDGRTFSTLGITSMGAITATVYPVSLKKDGEEQIFIYHISTHNNIVFAYTELYIKNEKGKYKNALHERCELLKVLSTFTSSYPDLLLSLVAINGTTSNALFRWDGKSDYKRVKENYVGNDKGLSAQKLSDAYTAKINETNNKQSTQINDKVEYTSTLSAATDKNTYDVLQKGFKTARGVIDNVKIIDADQLSPFQHGSAIIKKGNAYALIDSKGDFVVPFNVYGEIISKPPDGTSNDLPTTGLYIVYDSKLKKEEIINFKGKVIYAPPTGTGTFRETTGIGDNGFGNLRWNYAIVGKYRQFKEIHFNANGDVVTFQDLSNAKWNEGIATYWDDKVYKMGFKNSKGQIIITPQFDAASVFSESLCAVAKKNEFGELKWGYINIENKVVIPLQYSNQPGDFGYGLASVIPKTIDEFEFAFINKQGHIAFKIPANSTVSVPMNRYLSGGTTKFINGYFLSEMGGLIIDTAENVFQATELFRLFNLPTTYSILTKPFYNQQMYFTNGNDNKKGILDFNTKKYVPAIFDKLSMFDPVSNLAYAKLFIRHDDKNNKDIYREGYINKDGVFVMIKGEPEKF